MMLRQELLDRCLWSLQSHLTLSGRGGLCMQHSTRQTLHGMRLLACPHLQLSLASQHETLA